jgi:hypothetical protein
MMNRKHPWTRLGALLVTGAGMGILVAGCGKEEPAPPPPAPPQARNTAPPPPQTLSVADLMRQLNIDERVYLPENEAPNSTEARKAILEFFDAFARGDAQSAGEMMTAIDQHELQVMVDNGIWDRATDDIDSIEIQTGRNKLGQDCALAVIERNFEFEPQMWYYTIEGGIAQFEAAPTPPFIIEQLSGDWIEAWHRILEEEDALAMQPDEDFDDLQQDLDEGSDDRSKSAGGGGGRPGGPAGGGGGGKGRRKPPSQPRKPPGVNPGGR